MGESPEILPSSCTLRAGRHEAKVILHQNGSLEYATRRYGDEVISPWTPMTTITEAVDPDVVALTRERDHWRKVAEQRGEAHARSAAHALFLLEKAMDTDRELKDLRDRLNKLRAEWAAAEEADSAPVRALAGELERELRR